MSLKLPTSVENQIVEASGAGSALTSGRLDSAAIHPRGSGLSLN
jgi:hypothetical protein